MSKGRRTPVDPGTSDPTHALFGDGRIAKGCRPEASWCPADALADDVTHKDTVDFPQNRGGMDYKE